MSDDGFPLYDEEDLAVIDTIAAWAIGAIAFIFVIILLANGIRWWLSAF